MDNAKKKDTNSTFIAFETMEQFKQKDVQCDLWTMALNGSDMRYYQNTTANNNNKSIVKTKTVFEKGHYHHHCCNFSGWICVCCVLFAKSQTIAT